MIPALLLAAMLTEPPKVQDIPRRLYIPSRRAVCLVADVELSTSMVIVGREGAPDQGYPVEFFCKRLPTSYRCTMNIFSPPAAPVPRSTVQACDGAGCGPRVLEANVMCDVNAGYGCPCFLFYSGGQACLNAADLN